MGCAGESSDGGLSGSLAGVERAELSVGANSGEPLERPVAIVAGEPIAREALWAYLAEAGGGVALEEAALDALLTKECAARGLVVSQADVESERRLLEEAMGGEGGGAAVQQVRRARGLGPARWEGLLRRNAMLRALSSADVSVQEADIAREYALRHGVRVRALALTTRTASEAATARERVVSGELFARVAAEISTDASAARGGVIEPINLEDPTYPEAMRRALGACRDGEATSVIALDGGFGVLWRIGSEGGEGPGLEAVRGEMERAAALRQERAAMGRLAREMLERARVGALDPGLRWSWDGRRGADNTVGR